MTGDILRRLLPIGLGTLVVPLDNALNIAFPAITAHFGIAFEQLQWLIIGYVLTYGSLMLGVGRLGDIFGHALIFRAGLAVSLLAFLLCSLAPGYGWLLAGRVTQGIGAALVISCGPALLTAPFPDALRPSLIGLYTLCFSAGSVLGPSLGGWLTARFGWEAVFWFRAPIALAALLCAPRGGPPQTGRREPFDLPGALLLTFATASLLLAINRLGRGDWLGLPLGLLGALALPGFLYQSMRTARPVIALGLFRLPGFAWANAANALTQMAGFAVLLFVPFYLTGMARLPTGLAGLLLAVSPAGSMLVAGPAGWLLARHGARALTLAGIALTGLGLAGIALWGGATAWPVLAVALLLHGMGLGLLQVSITEYMTATLPRGDRGVAGSLAMMTRTLGVVSAASLFTLAFAKLESQSGFLPAFQTSFALAAAIPVLLFLGTVLLPRRR